MRSLVAVAEAGTITGAANRLGITQPALTRRSSNWNRNSARNC